jgi:CheY-like chemotaxis protein
MLIMSAFGRMRRSTAPGLVDGPFLAFKEKREAQMKVLLVDDSPLILKVAELFLRGTHEVMTASSGKEAFEKATREHPGLILMDHNMPGWTGSETRSVLAQDGRTRDIPVVIMTTEGHTPLDPAIDHLLKPFNQRELHSKLLQYA